MVIDFQNIIGLLTALGVVAGLYLNWNKDRANERKLQRDELTADYARVVKERDGLRSQIADIEKAFNEERDRLKARLAEKDETIVNLSRKLAQNP